MDTLNIGTKPEEPKNGKGIIWGAIAVLVVVALLIFFFFFMPGERPVSPLLTEERIQELVELSTPSEEPTLTDEDAAELMELTTSVEEIFINEERLQELMELSTPN